MKIKEGFTGQRYLVLPRIVVDMMEQDPLLSALHITDIGHYPRASHHFCERKDGVRQYILIYCAGGSGRYALSNKKWNVNAGQFFILPPDTPHAYEADERDPWTIYWIHFSGTLAPYYTEGMTGPQTVSQTISSRIRLRTDIFEEIYNSLQRSLAIDNLRYTVSLFHHYLGSLRYISEFRNAAERKSDDDIISHIEHFLSENLESRLSLDEIAGAMHLSPSRLSAIFKERTGHSVLNYFNLLKVRRACELLDNTEMKLNQICFKVGISDPYYFSRMFTKIMGLSPRAYRTRVHS